jgi:hypothetical protein
MRTAGEGAIAKFHIKRDTTSALGHYLSPDPLGLRGGTAPFAYVPDPTVWLDPYGLIALIRYKIRAFLEPQPGARTTGIKRAWKLERELLRTTGEGTRPWTPAEIGELLETGEVQGYTGHHINNVEALPSWQGDPRNIHFLTNAPYGGDHLRSKQGHRGDFQNRTRGRLIDRKAMLQQARKGGGCGK